MSEKPRRREIADGDVDRRSLLISGGLAAMAAVSAAAAGSSSGFVERMLSKRFVELSPERKAEILDDLEREYSERYGQEVTVSDTPPLDGVKRPTQLLRVGRSDGSGDRRYSFDWSDVKL